MIDALTALVVGWLCAVTQGAFFFALETLWSATFVTYFAVVLLWLCGSWLGLWLPDRTPEWPLALVTAAAPVGTYLLLQRAPFDGRWWPIYAVLIVGAALYAGYFFKRRRVQFSHVRWLFVWEAVGFVGGLLAAFLGMVFSGIDCVVWGPVTAWLALLGCVALGRCTRPKGSRRV